MTQDELQSLALAMLDELNLLKTYQQYLELALEQVDFPKNKSAVRLELLLSTYISASECRLDELTSGLKKLNRAVNKKSCTFILSDATPCTLQ